MKKEFLLLSFTFLVASFSLVAQKPVWRLDSEFQSLLPTEQLSPSWRSIQQYKQFEINFKSLRASILAEAPAENQNGRTMAVSLPMPDGSLRTFHVMESPVMEPELAAKYREMIPNSKPTS